MGLLLFVAVQFVLYTLLWLGVRWLVPADQRSYLIGALHIVAIMVIAFGIPRVYHYFRQRGWTADLRMWWSRFHCQLHTDFKGDPKGWDIDLLRVQAWRNHEHGTCCATLALCGLHLHLGLLVDPDESAVYKAARQKVRDAYIAGLPPQVQSAVRQMMESVPLEASIEVGAIPLQPEQPVDDDDDDDGEKVH
jgi:hypothetical protein